MDCYGCGAFFILRVSLFFSRPHFLGELFVPTISYRLHYGQSQTPVLEIIPDPSGLYRIAWPDIGLSDLANLTRCKQATLEWAEHQRMAKGSNLSVAQRLKLLKNFSWSASYSDLNRSGVSKAA